MPVCLSEKPQKTCCDPSAEAKRNTARRCSSVQHSTDYYGGRDDGERLANARVRGRDKEQRRAKERTKPRRAVQGTTRRSGRLAAARNALFNAGGHGRRAALDACGRGRPISRSARGGGNAGVRAHGCETERSRACAYVCGHVYEGASPSCLLLTGPVWTGPAIPLSR